MCLFGSFVGLYLASAIGALCCLQIRGVSLQRQKVEKNNLRQLYNYQDL